MEQDIYFLRKAIELSEITLDKGENPFACIITFDDKILAQAENRVKRDNDVTAHAEILAMREAQQLLKTDDLSNCVIYSNYEPCAMCAFMIRELKFKKVVFGGRSPIMGGYSRWQILQDEQLETLRPYFEKPPLIIPFLLEEEADKTFARRALKKA